MGFYRRIQEQVGARTWRVFRTLEKVPIVLWSAHMTKCHFDSIYKAWEILVSTQGSLQSQLLADRRDTYQENHRTQVSGIF